MFLQVCKANYALQDYVSNLAMRSIYKVNLTEHPTVFSQAMNTQNAKLGWDKAAIT